MKKDLKAAAAAASEAGRVKGAIDTATEEPAEVITPEAPEEKTKRQRVNIALTPQTFDYVKKVSIATGQTQQELLSKMVDYYIADHMDIYQDILDLANRL